MKIFNAKIIQALTGIMVNEDFDYELKEVTIDEILDIENFEKELELGFKNDSIVKDMFWRLNMGGSLPALILFDNMRIADGQHRLAAHLLNKTKKLFVLIKRPISNENI